jgi:hypothetical protein
MGQVLGVFELLDITMLRPVVAWRAFWNLRSLFLKFSNFLGGRGEPPITEIVDNEPVNTGARLHLHGYKHAKTTIMRPAPPSSPPPQ